LSLADGGRRRREKEKKEEFVYAIGHRPGTAEEREIQRQALAGNVGEQAQFICGVNLWLEGDNPPKLPPLNPEKKSVIFNWRNVKLDAHSFHARLMGVPMVAGGNLAFFSALAWRWSSGLAKETLWCDIFEQFPASERTNSAYEWEVSDLNRHHAWDCMARYQTRTEYRKGDTEFLEKCYTNCS